MSTTSSTICAAADALQGLVGYNAKSGHHIVRFSEDSSAWMSPKTVSSPVPNSSGSPSKAP